MTQVLWVLKRLNKGHGTAHTVCGEGAYVPQEVCCLSFCILRHQGLPVSLPKIAVSAPRHHLQNALPPRVLTSYHASESTLAGSRRESVTQKEWISERVVEVPWVLKRLKKGHRTVDIGCVESAYLVEIIRRVGFLYGIDTKVCQFRHPKFRFRRLNTTRRTPFRRAFFSQIVCISTLEHIGLKAYDNKRFPQGDLCALCEMYRILAPGGHLLVTVPFGQRGFYGWFKVYDSQQWDRLLHKTKFMIQEEQCFKYVGPPAHYRPCSRRDLRYVGYGVNRAKGVLCAVLTKEGTEG